MFATLATVLRPLQPRPYRTPRSSADDVRQHWEAALAAATSPQERDEINDVFGRAAA